MTKVLSLQVGHNVFDIVEVSPRISLSLLSLAYKEDKTLLQFGILCCERGQRPVVITEESGASYIDLMTARLVNDNYDKIEVIPQSSISYYNGCFSFVGKKEKAFIDKEVLIRNYGFGIIQ
ncbi:MAG: hypothetical protein IKW58_01225 [Alphaproteobacteria bacterium]|nr:hypothetical protein [Alphaproteobacteria bacterium]